MHILMSNYHNYIYIYYTITTLILWLENTYGSKWQVLLKFQNFWIVHVFPNITLFSGRDYTKKPWTHKSSRSHKMLAKLNV